MSFTNVDFPEPLTPVTATKAPKGIETSMFWRLFSRASLMVKLRFGLSGLRFLGTSILERPDMYAPVMDFLEFTNAS